MPMASEFMGGQGGAYLKAADLEGQEIEVTISAYEVKTFDQTAKDGTPYKQKKPILSFEEIEQQLVCNSTNVGSIAYACGEDLDDWIGKQITLYPTMVSFGTGQVEAIRVRATKKGGKPPKIMKPKRSENPADDMSDEVPF